MCWCCRATRTWRVGCRKAGRMAGIGSLRACKSPITMPRTLPLGVWRAMRRPSPIAWWMPGGRDWQIILAWATIGYYWCLVTSMQCYTLGWLLKSIGWKIYVNVNAWTPCGGPVLGAGGEPKENYIYKSVFTNRCTSGHAEVVERVKKCKPYFFVPRAVQPMSPLFVAVKKL